MVYISGTRADYGLMREVLREIDRHPSLKLSVLITGMHLLGDFGNTADEVDRDGFDICGKVSMELGEDSPAAMAKSLGIGLMGMVQSFEQVAPSIILLEGDRGESLAAASAAGHMGIAIAHMSGGDVTEGAIDESIRHAITKFSHIHFPGTELSAKRIRAMGENPKHVHMVGTPGCDLLSELDMHPSEVAKKLNLDLERPIVVVLQHPETVGAIDEAEKHIRETMEAVRRLNLQTVLIFPNADAGGRAMIRVIKEYGDWSELQLYASLPRPLYVGLLSVAAVMIGNSSSSLTDAPNFGLPAINVGKRQGSRERGGNIIDVVHDREHIFRAAVDAIDRSEDRAVKEACRQTPYRDDGVARKVALVLADLQLDSMLYRKVFDDRSIVRLENT